MSNLGSNLRKHICGTLGAVRFPSYPLTLLFAQSSCMSVRQASLEGFLYFLLVWNLILLFR
jgi:hypothetical protein